MTQQMRLDHEQTRLSGVPQRHNAHNTNTANVIRSLFSILVFVHISCYSYNVVFIGN